MPLATQYRQNNKERAPFLVRALSSLNRRIFQAILIGVTIQHDDIV
jgi:hypothetical protein